MKITGPKDVLSTFFPKHDLSNEVDGLIVQIREVLSRIDFTFFPKKAILRTLAEYCPMNSIQHAFIPFQSCPARILIIDFEGNVIWSKIVLAAIDSLKNVPIEVLTSLFGPLQPRYYSLLPKYEQREHEVVSNCFQCFQKDHRNRVQISKLKAYVPVGLKIYYRSSHRPPSQL